MPQNISSNIRSEGEAVETKPNFMISEQKIQNQQEKNTSNGQPEKQQEPVALEEKENISSYCCETWETHEIKSLFISYNELGSQWKVISQRIPNRSANNLKNRFYTILRNLVKLLFKNRPGSCPKLPGEIPSRELARLYDGRENYVEFPHFLSDVLADLGYDLQCESITEIAAKYEKEITMIYQILYREKTNAKEEESKNKADKSTPKTVQWLAPSQAPGLLDYRFYPQTMPALDQPNFYFILPSVNYWTYSNIL